MKISCQGREIETLDPEEIESDFDTYAIKAATQGKIFIVNTDSKDRVIKEFSFKFSCPEDFIIFKDFMFDSAPYPILFGSWPAFIIGFTKDESFMSFANLTCAGLL